MCFPTICVKNEKEQLSKQAQQTLEIMQKARAETSHHIGI